MIQKSLLGMDESSVRTAKSVQKFPELTALSYAFLQLASTAPGIAANLSGHLPKWRGQTEPGRISTGMMITEMRNAVWGLAVNGKNLGHFVNRRSATTKLLKFRPDLETKIITLPEDRFFVFDLLAQGFTLGQATQSALEKFENFDIQSFLAMALDLETFTDLKTNKNIT